MPSQPVLVLTISLALLIPASVVTTAVDPPVDVSGPVLSPPLERGGVAPAGTPFADMTSAKSIDGDPSDWIGEATRLGGTSTYSHGEWIHQGFLFDDHGADDGKDAERIATFEDGYEADHRTTRVEALAQAAGEQFGADDMDPTQGMLATDAEYGDAAYPPGTAGHADLVEVRLAADADWIYVLATFATMTDESVPALLIAADTEPGAMGSLGHGSGLSSTAIDTPLLLSTHGVTGAPAPGAEIALDGNGYTNALEAKLPRALLETTVDGRPGLRLAMGAGVLDPAAEQPILAQVSTGKGQGQLLDVARHEATVSNWFDLDQALALLDGTIDPFLETISLVRLETGVTTPWQPTPGYHERVFLSDEAISSESLRQGQKQGVHQHYGLYLPSTWEPSEESPMTLWLHWRGGTAHQAAAWTPRVYWQLGEQRAEPNVMIGPSGRGTSTWYLGVGHVDVLEAWADVHDLLAIDEDRRYVSGYSMGGFGSYLFGFLYPDWFAGAFPISGAVTHGAWAGVDEGGNDAVTDEGNARPNDVLTYRLIGNARNVPYVIHHGSNDELVPITGVQRVAAQFAQLGYRYQMYTFPGYEHFTQAVVDEWTAGAAYLDDQVREENPSRVVYKRIPAFERAVEEVDANGASLDFEFDGAYWLSELTTRHTDPDDPTSHALADVTSHHLEGPLGAPHTYPQAGAASIGHSTPYLMHGQSWLFGLPDGPLEASPAPVEITLANAASVRLDLARMGVPGGDDQGAELLATFTNDGPTELSLDGGWDTMPSTVVVGGVDVIPTLDDGVLTVTLPEGFHTLEIRCPCA